MKRHTKNPGKALDRFFARALKPSREQVESSRQKVLLRLTSASPDEIDESLDAVRAVRSQFMRPLTAAVAVAALVIAVAAFTEIIRNFAPPLDRPAIAQAMAGPLYRISRGATRSLQAGERIDNGAVIRSDRANGAVLALADGSRIEMRSQSEVSLEKANDGVRIRLTTGSVIVNAAKQRTGHLYVQTRDVTVSVVGTVFLVESAAAGSRVAVIQGEVHVQQGATLKKLLPGEQVTTAPSMMPVPVVEEISWSRNVEAHRALLAQALAIASAVPAQNRQLRQTFETVAITPRGPAAGRGLGLGLGSGSECVGRVQLDSKRFVMTNTTLYYLIALAYGTDCRISRLGDLISGLSWIKSDRFDIDAAIPDGASNYTAQQLNNHEAPMLQVMIQTLLADRFKLAFHRETKDTPVYNLVVVADGKLKPSENQNPPDGSVDPGAQAAKLGEAFVQRGMLLAGGALGMIIDESGLATIRGFGIQIPAVFSLLYTQIKDRPIIDKTNLKGRFDFQLQFAAMERVDRVGPTGALPATPAGPSLFDAIQEQLGLKLDAIKVPMEAIVIDRAEKPPQN